MEMITKVEFVHLILGGRVPFDYYMLINEYGLTSISFGITRKITHHDSTVTYEVLDSCNVYNRCTQQVYEYINNTNDFTIKSKPRIDCDHKLYNQIKLDDDIWY